VHKNEGSVWYTYFHFVDDPKMKSAVETNPGAGQDGSVTASRSLPICPNCSTRLQPDWEFCPGCGQENRNAVASFKILMLDFVGDFFTFDSRFFRTLGPFFFQPGILTREYLQGHRVRYVGPVRILVFGCIILFFLLGQLVNSEDFESIKNKSKPIIQFGTDSTQTISALEGDTLSNLKGNNILGQVPFPLKDSVEEEIRRSMARGADSSATNYTSQNKSFTFSLASDTSADQGKERGRNYSRIFSQIPALSDSLGPEEVADALVPEESYWRRKLVVQGTKVYQSGGEGLLSFMIGNGTVMVLLSVLLQALLLKLMYIRRKFHFIEHFIFATHSHAAFIYLLSILIAINLLGAGYFKGALLLLIPYLFISMYRVYQQSLLKSFLKFSFTSFVYMVMILPSLAVASIVISFLFF
jgi:hypothetical protein